MRKILIVPILALVCGNALAQSDVIYNGSRVIQTVKHTDGVWQLHRLDLIDRNTGLKYSVNKTVKVGKAVVGQAAKARMFGPWGAAIQVAAVAVGLYLDTQTEEVTDRPAVDDPHASDNGYCFTGGGGYLGGATMAACFYRPPSTITKMDTIPSGANGEGVRYRVYFGDHTEPDFAWDPITADPANYPRDRPSPQPPIVLTDEQLGEEIINGPGADKVVEELGRDPKTGQQDQSWGDFATQLSDAINDLTRELDGLSADAPIDDEDTGTESLTQTEPQPENLPMTQAELEEYIKSQQETGGSSLEVSARIDCTETPDILACLDTTEDVGYVGETELTATMQEIEFAGAATCPSLDDVPNIDWTMAEETICRGFEETKPVVLIVASIVALWIMYGGIIKV